MDNFKYQPAAPIPSKQLVAGGNDLDFIYPNGPSRCTWKAGADLTTAPHIWQPHAPRPKILPDILHHVGNTPLVRLKNIPKRLGIKCEILAKCEFFNPGGSVKDRIAIRMVEDAEQRGLLKEGDTIIEPTSGNTGIGLALAAAVKGYRCIIVMPMKMSAEKVDTLKALGAEVIRTPTAAGFESKEGLIAVAQQLCREIPNSIILDQYRNAFNPIAHYEHTAQEILDQCEGKVDAIVCGAGTGGTVCGIGRKIKDVLPNCKIVAADPLGSSLALPEALNKTDVTFYEVEGIGYDFIPTVLDRSVVDEWVKTADKDSLPMARQLIREEGLLCGGSSGSAMVVALEVAKKMKEGERLVVILPDGMRNYMTKFINDSWMQIRNFKTESETDIWWAKLPVSSLSLKQTPTIPADSKISDAIKKINDIKASKLFIAKNGSVTGVIVNGTIISALASGKVKADSTVDSIAVPVREIPRTSTLLHVSTLLEKEPAAIIADDNTPDVKLSVTSEDLINFIANQGK